MATRIPVTLEVASKRAFASAVDWPGWTRSGRTAVDALKALLAAAPRYAAVARDAGLTLAAPPDLDGFEVLEELPGGSGTEFGVPSGVSAADQAPVTAADSTRLGALLEASWHAFDASVAAAAGRTLRKGPRGGGRELDRIVIHVLEAELAYHAQLGSRPPTVGGEPAERLAVVRAASLDALAHRARGEPPADPNRVRQPWTPRYFVRRSAWHALDHAWEIDDRAE